MVKHSYPTSAVAYAGPLIAVDTSRGTLLPPIKRRRRKGGASEDDGPPIIGDGDIYNEDYRCGGPYLVKLPAVNRYIPEDDEFQIIYNQLREDISLVLEKCGITWTNTILISARKHELNDKWLEACKEIRGILINNHLGDVAVEMIDERASQRVLSAPIARTNPFYPIWPDHLLQILNILGDSEWTMLSPQLRGVSGGPAHITIVILVKEDSNFDWTTVRETVIDTLDSQGLDHVAVEIRRCSLLQFHSSPPVEGFLAKEDWNMEAHMGGKIQHLSGKWKRYGVTTHHCVTAIKSTTDWDKHGIKPGDPENELSIDYPSLKDHNAAIQYYMEEIESSSSLESYVSVKQRIEEGDSSISNYERQSYEYIKDKIEASEETLAHAHNFYQHGQLLLGKVYASSGYRINPNRRVLDWALIEMSSDRIFQNKLPMIDDIPKSYHSAYLPISEVLQGTTPLRNAMGVCKAGQSTGFSEGTLGAIRETDIQCWFQDEDGNWEKKQGIAFLIHPRAPRVSFGEPGDSGPFAFSLDGSFVGLYMGGDQEAGTGLFIEASDLFEDIKLVTGALDVRIPQG